MSTGQLCRQEELPKQFTYKILKKLERAGLVESSRGADGGYRLSAPLESVSLWELLRAVEAEEAVAPCLDPAYRCQWMEEGRCGVHSRLWEIQRGIQKQLCACTLQWLLFGVEENLSPQD